MTIYYSPASNGFYDDALHDVLPPDAVAVDADHHRELLAAQSAGQAIRADAKGNPVAAARPPQVPTVAQQILALEALQTPRRILDALTGAEQPVPQADGTTLPWSKDHARKVAALRAQLPAGAA